MIKKNSFICCVLTFIFLLSSCIGYDDKDYYKKMIKQNNIENLSYDNLEYFYHYASGFEDKIGLNYYYFSFDDYAEDFIKQFENCKNSFSDVKSTDFENELIDKIEMHINDKYYEIPLEYRVDFTKTYLYSDFPMIYYIDTNELIIFEFIYIR